MVRHPGVVPTEAMASKDWLADESHPSEEVRPRLKSRDDASSSRPGCPTSSWSGALKSGPLKPKPLGGPVTRSGGMYGLCKQRSRLFVHHQRIGALGSPRSVQELRHVEEPGLASRHHWHLGSLNPRKE